MSVTELHHHINLTVAARADIAWWIDFLPAWTGKSIILDCEWTSSSDLALFTDASKTLQCRLWSSVQFMLVLWDVAKCL